MSASPMEIALRAAAARIGAALCRAAYWDRDGRLCNWMGRSADEVPRLGAPLTPTTAALGPDLYGGSAGVALFLAELAAVTGDPDARRTARGGLARSLAILDAAPGGEDLALAFFAGGLGAAYVAHRVATRLGEPGLDPAIDRLIERAATAVDRPHSFDVIAGNAGAIPALLGLGRPRARELAVALGEELLREARREGEVVTWDAAKVSGPGLGDRMLTGLAHGASGLALALLELAAATGREDFRDAARGAFAYEDGLFDPERRNWPDLRVYEDAPAPPAGRPPTFARAWCHGAPGIALARLRAIALDPDRAADHEAVARAAVATTLGAIDEALAGGRADTSYCHGLAGLVEVVHLAGLVLGDAGLRRRAGEVARLLVARHGGDGPWPSGVASGGPNPTLMLGVSGVGHLLLRLDDPARVPPVLVLIPA